MFTDRQIRNLKPETKIKDIRGGRGFGIRVKPDGTKIFFYGYDSPVTGARRFLTLGEYPALSLEDARIKHGDAYKLVKSGGDPLEIKKQLLDERSKAPTVKDLCCEYIDRHAKKHKRSWRTDERILNHDVIPVWGKRKAADIGKRDVVLLLEKIVDRGSPIMANNTFAVIRKMFNFAVERDILLHTPCSGVKPPAPKVSRERVLTESEISTFWNNLDACSMSDEIRNALKLILATAQRPGEVIGMHTSEIDGEWWTIPGERAKNKKAHRVYLSAIAQTIVSDAIALAKFTRAIPQEHEYVGFIFPTPHKQKVQAIAPQALIVAVSRALSSPILAAKKGDVQLDVSGRSVGGNMIGVEHFTPHDLRRTAATFLASMGVMDEIIDAILNHVKQGIIRTYNRHDYDKEKQDALETWGRKLKSLI